MAAMAGSQTEPEAEAGAEADEEAGADSEPALVPAGRAEIRQDERQ